MSEEREQATESSLEDEVTQALVRHNASAWDYLVEQDLLVHVLTRARSVLGTAHPLAKDGKNLPLERLLAASENLAAWLRVFNPDRRLH